MPVKSLCSLAMQVVNSSGDPAARALLRSFQGGAEFQLVMSARVESLFKTVFLRANRQTPWDYQAALGQVTKLFPDYNEFSGDTLALVFVASELFFEVWNNKGAVEAQFWELCSNEFLVTLEVKMREIKSKRGADGDKMMGYREDGYAELLYGLMGKCQVALDRISAEKARRMREG